MIEKIGLHRPGDKINITVNRDGKELTFPVMLKNRDGKTDVVKAEVTSGYAKLGLEVKDLDAKTGKKLDISNGVIVTSLGNGKISKNTDMRQGFIITKINDVSVKNVKEFNELLKKKQDGELVILSGTYEDFPREFNYAFRF